MTYFFLLRDYCHLAAAKTRWTLLPYLQFMLFETTVPAPIFAVIFETTAADLHLLLLIMQCAKT
jgi:hypothetical protein